MTAVTVLAPAKLNLGLEIIGRRGDGYHEIATVMVAISIFDRLTVESANATVVLASPGAKDSGLPPISPLKEADRLPLSCEAGEGVGGRGSSRRHVVAREPGGLPLSRGRERGPGGEGGFPTAMIQQDDNTVLRAARLLRQRQAPVAGARLTLTKRIPAAAGLGGASSDAAAALIALNRLWNLDLAAGELASLAAEIGSDVPFFLSAGTARVGGRGEVLTPLLRARRPPWWFAVVVPPVAIPRKTATLYGLLRGGDFSDGAEIARFAAAIETGDISAFSPPPNAFLRPLLALRPDLTPWLDRLRGVIPNLALTGAGPAVFAVFDEPAACLRAAREARRALGPETRVYACRPVGAATLMRAHPEDRLD